MKRASRCCWILLLWVPITHNKRMWHCATWQGSLDWVQVDLSALTATHCNTLQHTATLCHLTGSVNSPSCNCSNPCLTILKPYSYQHSLVLLPHPIFTSTSLHQWTTPQHHLFQIHHLQAHYTIYTPHPPHITTPLPALQHHTSTKSSTQIKRLPTTQTYTMHPQHRTLSYFSINILRLFPVALDTRWCA